MPIYDILKTNIKKNKVLYRNFSSLSILQISQYLFPLITFPYLVRVLGPDGYGLVAFATAFVGYFTIFTDYGFNLSATRKISINRQNADKVSEIFSSVLTVKLLLFVLSGLLIIPIIYGFGKFSKDSEIYLISFITVLGTTLFPVWFFQGVERMNFITTISIVIKIVWVISVFVFVHSYDDIIILVSLNSASSLLTGIVGIIAIKFSFEIKMVFPNYSQIKNQFVDGWHYFLSQASISLYTISNIFILGIFAGDTVVGYFAAADRIRSAVQNISGTAGRTIFPHLSSEFVRSKSAAYRFINRYIKTMGSITLLFCILLFLFAEEIILIVLGDNYIRSIIILKIISFLPFIIFLSNVSGVQTMLNLGYKKEFANILIFAGIFNIILSFILVPYYFGIGTSISVVLTEVIVTFQMLLFLRKKNINIFKKVDAII